MINLSGITWMDGLNTGASRKPAMTIFQTCHYLIATIVLAGSSLAAQAAEVIPDPLDDPIAADIEAGELLVIAEPFVRLPQTYDSAFPPQTNLAYARIQYLQPVPDDSGRLAVNDLRGLLYFIDSESREVSVFLDLRTRNLGFDDSMFPNETGLAGVAFHPEYGKPGSPGYGRFYTAYSASTDSGIADYLEDRGNNHESVIREWTADDPTADVFKGTSREILRVGQFARNHNIGSLAFNLASAVGDADYGLLFASFGDGGAANDPNENGQDLSNPLSSILRIAPTVLLRNGSAYDIPTDNPFYSRQGAAREIWAYGLRHPQHFSFDHDGTMYIADIGQAQVEEINLGIAGANYGWRVREGTFATAFDPAIAGNVRPNPVYPRSADNQEFTYPVAQYDHDEGKAVSSVFVYRGKTIPALSGKLVFSDMVSGRIFYTDVTGLQPGNPSVLQELQVRIAGQEQNPVDAVGFDNTYAAGNRAGLRLGIDGDGELYILTKGDGWIRKLHTP